MEIKSFNKKNLLILKRNICYIIFEILFPILLILLCFALRQAFKLKTFEFEKEEETIEHYIQNKSVIYRTDGNIIDLFQNNQYKGLSIVPILKIFSPLNSKRPIIATIGIDSTIKIE